MLCKNVEAFVNNFDMFLTSKVVCYKHYNNLQLLPISNHQQKYLSIDFVIRFLILANRKDTIYDLILVIINQLTKMVYHELIKITINALGLVEVIINIIVY